MIGNGKVQIIINTTVSIKGDCDRCLSEVTFMVPVSVDQVIEISEGAVVADDDIGPYPFIVDEDIDVDELILDEKNGKVDLLIDLSGSDMFNAIQKEYFRYRLERIREGNE